jgi:hypothetical protein
MRISFVSLIWLVIGLVVALNRGYGHGVHSLAAFINLILAILLWPLVLLGVHFHIAVH